MQADAARALVVGAVADVAPEVQVDTLPGGASLREAADLDSMDYLAVLTAIAEGAGIDIPETDYVRLETLDSAVGYVVARTAPGRTAGG